MIDKELKRCKRTVLSLLVFSALCGALIPAGIVLGMVGLTVLGLSGIGLCLGYAHTMAGLIEDYTRLSEINRQYEIMKEIAG